MSRVIIVEDSTKSLLEDGFTIKKGQFQVGFVVGQCYEQTKKWAAFTFVSSKDSLAENLDVVKSNGYLNSFREYSKQVEASLSGGLHCIGFYIMGDSDSLKNCSGLLHQLVKIVFEMKEMKEYIYINVCNTTKKIICKSISNVNSASINLNFHPVDLKYNSLVSLLQSISSTIPINLTIYLNNKDSIKSCLDNALDNLQNEILNYQCILNNELVLPSEDINSIEKYCTTTNNDLFLELYSFNDITKTNKQSTTGATITITGNIYSRIYYYKKESLIDAVQCLKLDIIKSLRDRINLLENESLISEETESSLLEDNKILTKDIIWYLPSRIYVSTINSPTLLLSDYMFQEDTLQDSFNRLSQIHSNLNTKSALNTEQFLSKDDLKVLKGPTKRESPMLVKPDVVPNNSATIVKSVNENNSNLKLLVLISAIIVLLLSLYMAK